MQLFAVAAVLGLFAAAASADRPQAQNERYARIIAQDSDVKPDSYSFRYETENGISAQEQGREVQGIEAQGGFQYTGDDGQLISISYTAGEQGFLPQGAHIPTPPPIPAEILKALEDNQRDEAAGIFDDGQYRPNNAGPAQQLQQQPTYARAQASASGFRKPYRF